MKKMLFVLVVACIGVVTVYGGPPPKHHHNRGPKHHERYKGQNGVMLANGIINCVGNALAILTTPTVVAAPAPVVVAAPPPAPVVVAPPPPVVVAPAPVVVVPPRHMTGPVYNNGYVPHRYRYHRYNRYR